MIQQNRLKREKSLLTFPEWEMFLNKFKKHMTSVLPLRLSVSMPLFSAIKRQPSEGNR